MGTIVILADLCNTIIQVCLPYSPVNLHSRNSAISVFAVIGILSLLIYIAYALWVFFECTSRTWAAAAMMVIQGLLLSTYYYGDNAVKAFKTYASNGTTTEDCVTTTKIKLSALVCLVASLLGFQLMKHLKKWCESENGEKNATYEMLNRLLSNVTLLVQWDALYTVAEKMIDFDECDPTPSIIGCSKGNLIASILILIFFLIAAPFIGTRHDLENRCYAVVVGIVNFFFTAGFLLGDNSLPLNCITKSKLEVIVRLLLLSIAFVSLGLFLLCVLCILCKKEPNAVIDKDPTAELNKESIAEESNVELNQELHQLQV